MNKAKFLQAQVVLTDTMQGIFEITKPSGGKHNYCQLQRATMLLHGLETTQASMQTLF